ncbi:MAG: hypothetical protein ABR559_08965 [Gemmatimonadota bacterium]
MSDRPAGLEWAGWGLFALLTLGIFFMAIVRPTGPEGIYNEIRLAAGFDRYQAAMNEGDRLYSTAVAEFKVNGKDAEVRIAAYRMLAEGAERFELARTESEGFYENQRAQIRLAELYFVWARELHEEGNAPWYRGDDEATLRQGRAMVDQALALPHIRGDQRVRIEKLGTQIDRALTPWPIL